MLNRVKIRQKILAAVGIAAFAVSGCTMDTTGLGVASPQAQKIAFKDNCAPLRKPFLEIRAQRDQIIGQNVAAGVFLGALAGLAVGGDAKDALAGAVIGGLAGAAAAYAQNAASRGATEASLAKFANADARREAAQNDRLVSNIVKMNACRIDQADYVVVRAARNEISTDQARLILNRIKLETRKDNRAIQQIAGFNRTYNAYVGVLDKKDVAAAQATRRSVSTYKPQVRRVNRTSRGRAAIAPQRVTSAPTQVAKAENSRQLIRTAGAEHQETVDEAVAANFEKLLARKEV